MAKLTRNNEHTGPDELLEAIRTANLWIVTTIHENKDGSGATVSIRESHAEAIIDTIAMLLDQPEIYEKVQEKIASVKLKEKRNTNNPNVN